MAMRKAHVAKALSPLKEERWVITLSKISWAASSASGEESNDDLQLSALVLAVPAWLEVCEGRGFLTDA